MSGVVVDGDRLTAQSDTNIVAEFQSAIARKSASFIQLASAVLFSRARFTKEETARRAYERYVGPLTEAFEAKHGPIVAQFYCDTRIAGAVRTDHDEVYIVHAPVTPDTAPIAQLLFACERLNIEADRVLSGRERQQDRRSAKQLLYSVVAHMLALLDSPSAPNGTGTAPGDVDVLRLEVEGVRDHYLRAAARHAKFDYFAGMLYGIVPVLLLALAGSVFLFRVAEGFTSSIAPLPFCLLAGGLGAVVSAMSRMTFGGLVLDYEAGRRLLRMLGVFRPIMGMILGTSMWVATASGIIGLVPNEPLKALFFFVFVAFLAGFSERWAQDMLGRAENLTGGSGSPRKKPRGESARNGGGRR